MMMAMLPLNTLTYVIGAGNNVNLSSLPNAAEKCPRSYKVTGNVGSTAVGTPALDTGATIDDTFPIKLDIYTPITGFIGADGSTGAAGAGGAAGNPGSPGSNGGTGGNGGNGGTGLKAQKLLRVNNQSSINKGPKGAAGIGGGGGGGGGGTMKSCQVIGKINTCLPFFTGGRGGDGNTDANWNSGWQSQQSPFGIGGHGGGAGSSGGAGGSGLDDCGACGGAGSSVNGGAAGSAGANGSAGTDGPAIDGVSKITFEVTGVINGSQIN